MADEGGDREALLTALVTEQFVLQSRASATISEAGSRSSLYLLSLSSSLVALGFATQSAEAAFAPFAAALLPTMFLIGLFTIVRLVDTSIENVVCLRDIARIRRYYSTLTPDAAQFLPTSGSEADDAQTMLGGSARRWMLLFTMASMIGMVNAVLGATMVALLLDAVLGVPRVPSLVAAVVAAVGLAAAVLLYERRRFVDALGGP